MKKIIILVFCIILTITMFGCSTPVTNADEDGNILVYSEKDLPKDGFYIRIENRFYPVYPGTKNLKGKPFKYDGEKMDPERYMWMVNEDYLIPELSISNGDQLVYRSDNFKLNNSIVFEKFEDRGYTIGVGFSDMNESGFYLFDTNKLHPKSNAASIIGKNNAKDITVIGINESRLISSMFDASKTLINLEPQGIYTFNLYKGTEYAGVDITADTHLFFSSGIFETTSFSFTRNGYTEINLPTSIQPGLYEINEQGFIKIVD